MVEALRRNLGQPQAPDDTKAREEILLRIGSLQETRLHDREGTFASYREVVQSNPGSAAAVAGLERLVAAGTSDADQQAAVARLTLPFYERTDNAAELAAAEPGAALGGRHARRAGRAARKTARPLRRAAGRRGGRLPRQPGAVQIDPADAPNRGALIGFSEKAGTTAELCDKLRAASEASTDRHLRRDLLVIVAELEEKRLGRAPEAEKVYAQILLAEPLHEGAFRALARLYRDGRTGPSCARCSTPASWPRSSRASASICWRRSPSSTSPRWPTPSTRSGPTRRCWSSIRPIYARTAGSIGTTPRWSAGAISRPCSERASASPPPV